MALFLFLLPSVGWSDEDAQVEKKEAELKTLRSQIDTLQGELQGKQDHHKNLLSELRKAEEQIGRQTRKLRVLAGRLKRQQKKLENLRSRKRQDLAEIESNRNALAKQLRAAYIMGRQERIKILQTVNLRKLHATLLYVLQHIDFFLMF